MGGAGSQGELRDKGSVGGYLVICTKVMGSKSRFFLKKRKSWNLKNTSNQNMLFWEGQGDDSEGKDNCPD